jgi:hypothetical protein
MLVQKIPLHRPLSISIGSLKAKAYFFQEFLFGEGFKSMSAGSEFYCLLKQR